MRDMNFLFLKGQTFCLIVILLLPVLAHTQTTLQTIGHYQYARYNDGWYTTQQGRQGDLVDTNHVIVRPKNNTKIGAFVFAKAGLPTMKDTRGSFSGGYFELEVPKGLDPFFVAHALEATSYFDEILFNVFYAVESVPNDPRYPNQWAMPKTKTHDAWDITTGSANVIVAIIDVGADYNHEDLVGNLWSGIGYDFYDNDADPYPSDDAGHGTAVAGIVAARTNNGLGVAGVAGGWASSSGVKLMHLDAGYRAGLQYIDVAAASQATDWAASHGAKVINMSFGGFAYSPLEVAINNAVNNYGVIVVASAGNYEVNDPTSVDYPAAYPNVIAVGATIENDNRKTLNDGTDESFWGSCYGPELDLVAPGIHVWTTDMTVGGYDLYEKYFARFNGTSAAAPHVAGLVALLLSRNPSITPHHVRAILQISADKVPGMGGQNFHGEYGYGRINANNAIRLPLYVPQVYSTLVEAAGFAVSGQTIILAAGTHTVPHNVTIANGVTLQTLPGSTISFAGSAYAPSGPYKLRVEGKLIANGTTFTSSSGYWYGIEFYNGNNGSSIQYSTIENAQYGVYTYATDAYFTHNTIRNNSTGIYVYAYPNSINWNLFENNTHGVECAYYGDANIQVNNVLRYNGWAVYGDAYSNPALGSYIGYNSLYWNDYYDVFSYYGGTIYARGNWWGDYPAYPSIYGDVDYSGELSVDPNSWATRMNATPAAYAPKPEMGLLGGDTTGIAELNAAYGSLRNRDSLGAFSAFSALLARYPDHFV